MKKYIAIFIILLLICVGWYAAMKTPTSTSTQNGSANQEGETVLYSCDAGKTISATYSVGAEKAPAAQGQPPVPGGSVKVSLSDGRVMTLPQTISASGIRYANPDESFVFWSKGNGAVVLENNAEKSYIGCIKVAPATAELPAVYSNSQDGFSLRLPSLVAKTGADGYVADETYNYQANPQNIISGIKFTIPASITKGTNLSTDTYVSVESIPQAASCSANLFMDGSTPAKAVTENGTTYSVASVSNAGAGNRYEETVYAIPGTNPCVAVRYLVHYGVVQNYPEGTVKEFDKEVLLKQFDLIRQSLVINQ